MFPQAVYIMQSAKDWVWLRSGN